MAACGQGGVEGEQLSAILEPHVGAKADAWACKRPCHSKETQWLRWTHGPTLGTLLSLKVHVVNEDLKNLAVLKHVLKNLVRSI